MRNVHERRFPTATPAQLGELLDAVGSPGDRLWPTTSGRWPAMRMSGPLSDHPSGGHGFVRYHVIDHVPGRSVTWRFEEAMNLPGIHRFDVLDDATPGLRHTIEARPRASMRLAWPLAVRWLHDALIEEAFDGVEVQLGTRTEVRTPSALVRALLMIGPSVEKEESWARSQV